MIDFILYAVLGKLMVDLKCAPVRDGAKRNGSYFTAHYGVRYSECLL